MFKTELKFPSSPTFIFVSSGISKHTTQANSRRQHHAQPYEPPALPAPSHTPNSQPDSQPSSTAQHDTQPTPPPHPDSSYPTVSAQRYPRSGSRRAARRRTA